MIKFILPGVLLLLQVNSIQCQTTISGTIHSSKNRPVAGANIYITGTLEGTTSGEQGNFTMTTNLMGTINLGVSCIGYKAHVETVILQNNVLSLTIILSENDIELNEVTVWAGTFEAGDKKKSVVLNRLDFATNPIEFGDALSIFRTLPGTSNSADEGGLIVRGGEQHETKTFIDGLLVESPFTAKMPGVPVRGRFSPMLFKGTIFSTGGYSAEYGQALSSVLILNSIDEPGKDEAGLSLLSSGANINVTRKYESGSVSASTQYLNLSPYYSLSGSTVNWHHAPETFSQMFFLRKKIGSSGIIKVLTNLSVDRTGLFFHNLDTETDDLITQKNNDLFITSSFKGVIGRDLVVNSGLTYNINSEKLRLNQSGINNSKESYELKLALTKPVGRDASIKFGGNVFRKNYTRDFLQPAGESFILNFNSPIAALFAESETKFFKRVAIRAGARAEYIGLSNEAYISPRLSVAYKTSSNGQISFGYGSFSEQPAEGLLVYSPRLKSEKADHYIVNYQLAKNSRLFRIEGYYKEYTGLVKYTAPDSPEPDAYNNLGGGYAKGIDLFYRDSKTVKNGDFWISYSLIDSKRDYRDYRFPHSPFYISRHNLSVIHKQYLSSADSYISMGYQYSSGRPYIDPNIDMNLIKRTKPFNSLNLSAFHFTELFGQFTMIYTQITNILGSENIFGYRYACRPDNNGIYRSEPLVPLSRRFFLIGLYISFNGKPEI